MNTFHNKRFQETEEQIKGTFLTLLKKGKLINEIYVQDICRLAGISRPTFYTHYEDINDLILRIEHENMQHIHGILIREPVPDKEAFLKYFTFLKENQSFYTALFSTNDSPHITEELMHSFAEMHSTFFLNAGFDMETISFLMTFFCAGLKALALKWLLNGCRESPQEMVELLEKAYCVIPDLYHGRNAL